MVREFITDKGKYMSNPDIIGIAISQFKQSHSLQPEQKRIEVTQMWDLNNVYQEEFVRTGFQTSQPIPEDKFPVIKKAIESVLNNDGDAEFAGSMPLHSLYTPEEIEAIEIKAFVAGREPSGRTFSWSPRYSTFEDYKKARQSPGR